MKNANLYIILLGLAGLVLFLFLIAYFTDKNSFLGPLLVSFFVFLAFGVRGNSHAKGFSFTIMIFAAVSISMFYPALFLKWGDFELSKTIIPLIQIIMFGMGSQMSFRDFAGVVKMPKGVLLGLVCQFTIMPIVGFTIATTFGFPPEVAAGRDSLLEIGFLLILACLLHNTAGYFLGYWICKLARMDEKSCRTIALEVGMQNGGLASGIALQMGRVATVGLAPAVFGPMMNITGSSLATWWRRLTPGDENSDE
jgi:predicted Na+-dependent transporter